MKVKGRLDFLFGWLGARRGARRAVGGADGLESGAL
jgi:hypothetical protein